MVEVVAEWLGWIGLVKAQACIGLALGLERNAWSGISF